MKITKKEIRKTYDCLNSIGRFDLDVDGVDKSIQHALRAALDKEVEYTTLQLNKSDKKTYIIDIAYDILANN